MRFSEFGKQLDEIMPALAKVGQAAGRVGTQMGAKAGKTMNKVQSKVGAMANKNPQGGQANKLANKVAQKTMSVAQKQMLKKGAKLPIPSQANPNKPQDFEVGDVKGDEVTLVNPKPKPGEPVKTVHKKKDLEPIIKQITSQ